MQIALGNMVIELAEGRMIAFRGARDVNLECTEGVIWLTVDGLADDFLLAKGERLRFLSNGLTLIQGMPAGSAHLVNEEPKSIHEGNRFAWFSRLFAAHMVA